MTLHDFSDIFAEIDSSDEEKHEITSSHRHSLFVVFWIHEGIGTHLIDFMEYDIVPDRIFFLSPEQVHLMRVDNQKIKYSTVQFSEDYYLLFAKNSDDELPVFTDITNNDDKHLFRKLFFDIRNEISNDNPFKFNVLQGQIYLLLFRLLRVSKIQNRGLPKHPEIIEKYQKLIDENFKEKHLVSDYAQMLGIGANYLNVLTKKHLGVSALDLITGRIILEIKRKLLDSPLSISEICYMLGFNEVSYFSRFFFKHTGERPVAFRNRMNKMYQKT
jgi:AraC-like DNA-binding protein